MTLISSYNFKYRLSIYFEIFIVAFQNYTILLTVDAARELFFTQVMRNVRIKEITPSIIFIFNK